MLGALAIATVPVIWVSGIALPLLLLGWLIFRKRRRHLHWPEPAKDLDILSCYDASNCQRYSIVFRCNCWDGHQRTFEGHTTFRSAMISVQIAVRE
jgi:hypothetical protein